MANHLSTLRRELRAASNPERARASRSFFRTGPGEYGAGDRFLGATVTAQRAIARRHRDLPRAEVRRLLASPFHEERLVALWILVDQFQRGDERTRAAAHRFHRAQLAHVNNWDLVDLSTPVLVGEARAQGADLPLLRRLAGSRTLWRRRVAIVATYATIRRGDPRPTLEIAALLLDDPHDLIHKATGWMLREVGKRCSKGHLKRFLRQHGSTMPRTMLRYAIERFPEAERQRYLARPPRQVRELRQSRGARAVARALACGLIFTFLAMASAPLHAVTLRPLGPRGTSEGTEAIAWSPDGTTIAAHHWFVGPPDYFITSFVFAYEVASGAPVVIRGLGALPHGPEPGLVMHPTWSPDGTHLGVSSDFRLWTVSVADSSATQVSFEEARSPAWSPDGARFVYAGTGGLWTVRASGGFSSRLTAGFDASPAWSHDGTRIAFARAGDIWLMAANGGTAAPVTSGPEPDAQPSWSPDGTLVAFASLRGGQNDIWVVRAATGQLSRLTNDAAVDFSPAWSPDGAAIAFISDRDGTQRIWIATDLGTVTVTPMTWSDMKSRYR